MSAVAYWIDHLGRKFRVPEIKDRLRPHQIRAHAALKSFVIHRDGGRCKRCGSTDNLLADHIVSRRNGGTHHPDNLQCLCKTCNDRKSNFEDRGRTSICGAEFDSHGVTLVCAEPSDHCGSHVGVLP